MNYVQYGKSTKSKKGKKFTQSGASGGNYKGSRGHGTSSLPGGKGKKLPFLQDTCYRCGKGRHQKIQDCKALDVVCRGCGKKGHFEKTCLKGKCSAHSMDIPETSNNYTNEPLYFNDDGQPVYIHMVSVLYANKHLIKFLIDLDHSKLRGGSGPTRNKMENPTNSVGPGIRTILLKADTGADVNLMNKQTFDQLCGNTKDFLQPTPVRMENYGNSTVKVLGTFHTFLRWKGWVYKQLFYVTDCNKSQNLLSCDACYTLGVLKPCYTVEHSTSPTSSQTKPSKVGKSFPHCRNEGNMEKLTDSSSKCSVTKEKLQGGPLTKQNILDVYSDIFTGIGKFPGSPYKFQLKPNAKPARHAPRKVPVHLQDAFHEEIKNLEKLGILEETKDVTEWVNSFVIIEKKLPINSSNHHSPGHTIKKKLRICLDPQDLNEALEREAYYTCFIEEIIRKFHGMTKFTIADFNKGYWMVILDPESRKYTTMALDIGLFQWTRLSMGSIVAQDVFQRKLDAIFLDVPGVTGIADDMVIYGRTNQEHDKHLVNFLEICRKNTLTLNPEKMQFRLPQVSFFRHHWSAWGLSPDPKKIEAVKHMELPWDLETMGSFPGLVNYLNRFSPCLAELSDPLRQICRKSQEFKLNDSVHVAFLRTKEEISRNVTLPYFNPDSSTTLQTDTSKKGLGAVLLQNSKPVMFASRALTGTERNYQNLERECLATIWGMEKFHYFIYGKEFTWEMDQKPLVSIYRKHMVEISPRIQRLIVRSFPYQPFDVQYRKGVEIPLADALSRVTPTPVEEDGILIVAVNLITANIPISSTEIEPIHQESLNDPTFTVLQHYINMGWPSDRRNIPKELHTCWNYKEDLSMENGLITKGARILIPSTLWKKILEQIHDGHQGIEKCMLKAREAVFWPGISSDIREAVDKCEICQSTSKSSKPVGNISEVPPHAWHTLGQTYSIGTKSTFLW